MAMSHVQLSGRFKIDSLINGIITTKVPWQDNLIVNTGLDRLSSGGIDRCVIGSGVIPPEKTNIELGHLIASALITQQPTVPYTVDPWGSYTPFLATFTPPGAEYTISELGLAWDSGLFSRALLKNMLGAVQPIIWYADETLIITYYIIVKPILTDLETDIVVLSIPYKVTSRACHVNDSRYWRFYNGAQEFQKLGDGTFSPDGILHSEALSKIYFGGLGIGINLSEPSGGTIFKLSYSYVGPSSRYQIGKFVANVNAYDTEGIIALMITSTIGTIQYKIDPPIMKYSDDIFEIIATTPIWDSV